MGNRIPGIGVQNFRGGFQMGVEEFMDGRKIHSTANTEKKPLLLQYKALPIVHDFHMSYQDGQVAFVFDHEWLPTSREFPETPILNPQVLNYFLKWRFSALESGDVHQKMVTKNYPSNINDIAKTLLPVGIMGQVVTMNANRVRLRKMVTTLEGRALGVPNLWGTNLTPGSEIGFLIKRYKDTHVLEGGNLALGGGVYMGREHTPLTIRPYVIEKGKRVYDDWTGKLETEFLIVRLGYFLVNNRSGSVPITGTDFERVTTEINTNYVKSLATIDMIVYPRYHP